MFGPVLPSAGVLSPLGLDAVRLIGGFWGRRQAGNGDATIPHALSWIEKTGWLDNLRLAATGELGVREQHRGREFSDSEVFKLAEAMVWERARGGEAPLDELVAVIAAAQEPDGYLGTVFGRPSQPPRWSQLDFGHELYCLGHLIQAGVAALRTGVSERLGEVAVRAADHVCTELGPHGRPFVCGHPEIEMALVELYRVTGRERYLEQARLFLDRRGRGTLPDFAFGRAYYQDDVPIRTRRVFAGHAVRELYLASGVVDVAVETGDDELLATVIRQWERTVAARTYLTGGMGARHEGESFGEDFELPPDRAYNETCAGVASVMLSHRLLLATGEPRFADLAERTLYNVIAAAVSLDGRAFFYTNPLQQRVPGPAADPLRPNPRETSGERAPWYEVSCCPTNLARTLASLGGYLATADATPGSNGVQLHHYAPSRIVSGATELAVATGYPWDGDVAVRVTRTDGGPFRLTLRVPAWAPAAELVTPDEVRPVGPGTTVVERRWLPGDEVCLRLPVAPRWTAADPRIDAVRGCIALERGPLVYCTESIDRSTDPSVDGSHDPDAAVRAAEPTGLPVADRTAAIEEAPVPALGDDVVGLTVPVRAVRVDGDGWPYGQSGQATDTASEPGRLELIPYHLWANRGPAAMRVWLPSH